MRQRCQTRRVHFRSAAVILSAGLVLTACGGGESDTSAEGSGGGESCAYPEEDITFVVPYGPGGSTTPLARKYTELLEEELEGSTIVVENREGGSATVGTSAVATAEPDGYTIGMTTGAAVFARPMVTEGLPWDGIEDFQPIALMGAGSTLLAVREDSEFQTLDDLLEYAEENPGEIQVGVSNLGGTQHLGLALVAESAGVELEPVPFSGGCGEALVELLGGRVDVLAGQVATLRGHLDSGEVRALAVMSDDDDPTLPEVPTTAELGLSEGLAADLIVVAPKGIPDCVRDRLADASARVLESSEYVEFMEQNGYRVEETVSTPDELAANLEEDAGKYEALRDLLTEN